MIRTVIVDDEERSRQSLINLLNKYCTGIQIIGQADNIKNAVELIKLEKPKLLFLDIKLREGTSFEILNQLSPYDYFIIFTTAYDEYAIKAFKFNSVDYLLKPISLAELIDATEKVKKYFIAAKETSNSNISQLLSFNLQDPTISIATENSIEFIRVFDITRLESDGGYTIFYLVNGKTIVSSKNLKVYEEILSDYNFFRSHHSHMVNIKYIIRLLKSDGGSLELKNGTIVPLSRRRRDQFLKLKI